MGALSLELPTWSFCLCCFILQLWNNIFLSFLIFPLSNVISFLCFQLVLSYFFFIPYRFFNALASFERVCYSFYPFHKQYFLAFKNFLYLLKFFVFMITLNIFDLDVFCCLKYNLTFLNFKKVVCSGKLFKCKNPIICGFFPFLKDKKFCFLSEILGLYPSLNFSWTINCFCTSVLLCFCYAFSKFSLVWSLVLEKSPVSKFEFTCAF